MDTAIERRRKAKQCKSPDLETQQRLFGRRAFVEGCQEPHCCIEHGGLGLVVGHALANDGQRCTGGPNGVQASENLMKRSIDRNPLQVCELTAAGSEIRVHQDVRLQCATKPPLTLASAAGERRHLAVVLR
jgi:hypothetical protein